MLATSRASTHLQPEDVLIPLNTISCCSRTSETGKRHSASGRAYKLIRDGSLVGRIGICQECMGDIVCTAQENRTRRLSMAQLAQAKAKRSWQMTN